MKTDDEIVESLISGGIIGAALGALLSKNKENGATLGAIAGAAILATFKANQEAKKTKVPMYLQEDNNLYVLQADGTKHFVKSLEKKSKALPNRFTLK